MNNKLYESTIRTLANPVGLWLLVLLFILVDYSNGPVIQFPITFLLPVIAAAWWHGKKQAFALAVIFPIIRLAFNMFVWTAPWSLMESLINTVIRMAVFLVMAYFVARVREQNEALAKEVKTLSGILPICGFCKKIRTEQNEWVPVETYVRERSDADFSHGFCPECGREHYGDLLYK